MTPTLFSALFVAALLLTTSIKLWLAQRQLSHIKAFRDQVPNDFANQVSLTAHQKAADYTSAKTRLTLFTIVFDMLVLMAFTLGGGVQLISTWTLTTFQDSMLQGISIIVAVLAISSLLDAPFELYNTFVIEARFGFNKMTFGLYLLDTIKEILLGAILGLPLLWAVLWLMEKMGEFWWVYVWLVWVGFNLLLLFIYPNFIAPLFNKFQPLQDDALKQQIESLMQRCGFTSSGLFVMDGSKRSSHGNAYFTGFGSTKRIVFFDTLLQRLTPPEINAVLAHELGHFKHRHVIKRIMTTFALSLAFLWLLAQLMQSAWFFQGLGVSLPATSAQSTALALLLLFMVLPSFTFLLQPLSSYYSRKHEFEADRYAAEQTDARDLSSALVKLYQDNAKTLTPDPLYATFYETHPPAQERIAKLKETP